VNHPECLHATANSSDDYSGVTCCLCDGNPCSDTSPEQRKEHARWFWQASQAPRPRKHDFLPDPMSPGDCRTCGFAANFGALHYDDSPVIDDDEPVRGCDGCGHFPHRGPCEAVVARRPQVLCGCGTRSAA
jgi:hypothetical protein